MTEYALDKSLPGISYALKLPKKTAEFWSDRAQKNAPHEWKPCTDEALPQPQTPPRSVVRELHPDGKVLITTLMCPNNIPKRDLKVRDRSGSRSSSVCLLACNIIRLIVARSHLLAERLSRDVARKEIRQPCYPKSSSKCLSVLPPFFLCASRLFSCNLSPTTRSRPV